MSLNKENILNKNFMNVAVIGGGLVGALTALNLAKRGYDVHVYEYRNDIRNDNLVQGRSINLALSYRGRKALAEVGLEKIVLEKAIAMKGRMLHDRIGKTSIIIYDPTKKQCLYSVGRKELNEILLTAGENYSNLKYHFHHKLLKANFDENIIEFNDSFSKKTIKLTTELVIGCDGAFSRVRQEMMKIPGFNYSQQYIDHKYLELCIPSKNNEFQMPENFLHIWPRDTFMMIALPNHDKSFTVTLSMPAKIFQSINTREDLVSFFTIYYMDFIPLVGEEKLVEDFFKYKPQHLLSIKCNPYHYKKNVLILGDAAHAMVPYFGQGMNAGMEDCTILLSILNKPNIKIGEVLQRFSEERWQDAHAICDLAMDNYLEMRDKTKRFSFRCRKWLDSILFHFFPNTWIPLYNSVSFSNMKYNKCIENRKWQDQLIKIVLSWIIVALLTLSIIIIIE